MWMNAFSNMKKLMIYIHEYYTLVFILTRGRHYIKSSLTAWMLCRVTRTDKTD